MHTRTPAPDRCQTTTATLRGYRYDCRTRWHPSPVSAPVVLVGGAFQRRTAWGRLEAALSRTATVVTVDLPGWGNADLLPAGYDMGFLADALHRVLTAAGHGAVHVFGGSYGGAIALRYAQNHPRRTLTLTLMGTGAHLPPQLCEALAQAIELARSPRRREFADHAVELLLCGDPRAAITRGPVTRRILRTLFLNATADDTAKFEQNTLRLLLCRTFTPAALLTMPVLLGTGEHDDFTPPALCRELAAYCSDARFALLRHADHAVHLEVPDELANLLTRFHTGQCLRALPHCAITRMNPVVPRHPSAYHPFGGTKSRHFR